VRKGDSPKIGISAIDDSPNDTHKQSYSESDEVIVKHMHEGISNSGDKDLPNSSNYAGPVQFREHGTSEQEFLAWTGNKDIENEEQTPTRHRRFSYPTGLISKNHNGHKYEG
jgi:hypothetical protein